MVHLGPGTCVANALFIVHECVGNYTLPLDHSVLVRSDICQLGYHGDPWDYVWSTCFCYELGCVFML